MNFSNQPKQQWVSFLAFGAFAAILFGIKLWLIGSYGNATPFWDQWDGEAEYLYKPFLEGTLSWNNLIALHNEHRMLTVRLLSLALLVVNGIWNPLLELVVNALLHVVSLGFCIALLARAIGRNHLPALLVFSLVLFGVPYAWENTLMAYQSFYFVFLFSLASLWLTVNSNPLSARWWGGVVCAMLAFLSLASGIFALAAAAVVGLALYVTGLRKTLRQLIAVGILAGLFMVGAALTPSLAHHAYLKAASFPQFFGALIAVLGWPISSNFLSAFFRSLPAFAFVGVMLWKRPPADDRRWFLLALVVWTLGQAVSIAYGRAVGPLASRYMDLFAIGILVNFACLISIAQDHMPKRSNWKIAGVSVWIAAVLLFLGVYTSMHIPTELAAKRDTGLAQEINTRNYLATGDLNHLKNKPSLAVPYPDPARLASILASPTIRAILPPNISPPLTPTSTDGVAAGAPVVVGKLDAFIKLLLVYYFVFIVLGVVAVGVLVKQVGLTLRRW